MFNVILEDAYFTGMACKVGKFENGIDVESLPNETDEIRQKAYKLENGQWVFDEIRYQELLNHKNKELENLKIQERISELKSLLNNSDYKAIKYAEGLLTDEEYSQIRQQRQDWREEINQLEQVIYGRV